ncbi:Flp pilus assembly complex ATPase component TadA [Brevibacillus ruminantium]|uniref:Flp pilus assembly complex ATPase component TadA n=1 Tax=Brevibacillus ruminantium TaxID=2950604 RepID=A0ABY4WIV5_9BACL|nr:ATPase, T2SS/T4P/T4SS family [Brevibacillus ruminantium]USG65972.1 Flp pilus assembly complex ATPase component TadA [Brevibacillus ruminantium]
MSFQKKTLLGIQTPQRERVDLRSEAKKSTRESHTLQEIMQIRQQTPVDRRLSPEAEAAIRTQIVEKHGKRLWEEKAQPAYLQELAKDIRLLLEAGTPLSSAQMELEVERLIRSLTGWGPLDPLLDNPDITEIMFHRYDHLVVERKSTGRLEVPDTPVFRDEDEMLRLLEQIAATMGREFNETKAELNTQLPDGSRVAATHRSISPDGHMLTIRKHRDLLTEQDYLSYGSICEPMLTFLKWAIGYSRASGIVSGGTGSGKTHLLNLISQYVPHHLSIITIEDVLEMKLQHPFVRRFLAKPANYEGKGGFSIKDCVRLSLRKRPDVIIVGETRGGEIVDMLWAMNTDHPGSWSTAHANSPRALIDSTLPILFAKAEESYSTTERNLMIGSALDLIVQVKRFEEDGSRKVVAITEVVGTGQSHEERIRQSCNVRQINPDRVYLQDIYVYEPTGIKNGRVVGQYKWTGYRPEQLVRRWTEKGLRQEEWERVFFTTPIPM